jgi:hypothetical protein
MKCDFYDPFSRKNVKVTRPDRSGGIVEMCARCIVDRKHIERGTFCLMAFNYYIPRGRQ